MSLIAFVIATILLPEVVVPRSIRTRRSNLQPPLAPVDALFLTPSLNANADQEARTIKATAALVSKHATDATTDRKPLPSPPLLADPQTTFATLSLLKVDRTPILNPLTLPVLGKTTTTMPRALQQAINNEAVKEQDQQDRLTNPPYSLTLLKKPHPGSPSPAKRQPPHTTPTAPPPPTPTCECQKYTPTAAEMFIPTVASLVAAQTHLVHQWKDNWCHALDPPKNVPLCITPVKAVVCCGCDAARKTKCVDDCLTREGYLDADEKSQTLSMAYCGYACQGCDFTLMPMVETEDNGIGGQREETGSIAIPKWWTSTMAKQLIKVRAKLSQEE